MNQQEIENSLVEVLTLVLGRNISHKELTVDEKIWDSLKHIEIVFAVEERFSLQFTDKELPHIGTCRKLLECLKQKHGA